MFKADAAASVHHKVAGLGVIIVAVAPCADFSGTIAYLCVHIRIKQPERNIDSFDFVDMVLILKNFRQKAFSGQVFCKPRLCRLFIQLKRNDKVRLKGARKLPHHHNRVAAERTGGGRRVFVTYNFAAAGLAYIGAKSVCFSFLPLGSGGALPAHIIRCFILQHAVIIGQCFHFKFRVTKGTFHFLERAVKVERAVKGYRTAAAWAFIFL